MSSKDLAVVAFENDRLTIRNTTILRVVDGNEVQYVFADDGNSVFAEGDDSEEEALQRLLWVMGARLAEPCASVRTIMDLDARDAWTFRQGANRGAVVQVEGRWTSLVIYDGAVWLRRFDTQAEAQAEYDYWAN